MGEQTDEALVDLCGAVTRAQEQLDEVLQRAALLQDGRSRGLSYAEIVASETAPLLVERLTHVLDELSVAGSRFRRSEARVLHRDGLSMDTIAGLFGVTRQRVSVLLKDSARPV